LFRRGEAPRAGNRTIASNLSAAGGIKQPVRSGARSSVKEFMGTAIFGSSRQAACDFLGNAQRRFTWRSCGSNRTAYDQMAGAGANGLGGSHYALLVIGPRAGRPHAGRDDFQGITEIASQ
jgi:hypothetical protein